ncbi:MAG: Asp-tRNA(Asn)/Glu-tRNA(Gln) amidotransferase subunit GatC [Muricomes sp.]
MEKQMIDDAVMENVEILAKLALTPEEREAAKEKMQEILIYMDKLNELDTKDVEPLFHTFPVENVFRGDVVTNEDNCEAMLKNAPKTKDNQYQVPKTV